MLGVQLKLGSLVTATNELYKSKIILNNYRSFAPFSSSYGEINII